MRVQPQTELSTLNSPLLLTLQYFAAKSLGLRILAVVIHIREWQSAENKDFTETRQKNNRYEYAQSVTVEGLFDTMITGSLDSPIALLRGLMGWLQNKFEKNFLISTVDYVFNWARKSAVWPMTFGLACCAIEMIASSTARFDIARFGSEVFRPSPRQSDLMIVAGTVTLKMAPVVKRIYDQMPDPKWVISMGACSSVGGPFNTYAVLQGVDKIVPVDVYVTGCPPRPENLFYALLKLQDKIDTMTLAKKPTEVRLDPNMVENFKRQVMIAQTLQPK